MDVGLTDKVKMSAGISQCWPCDPCIAQLQINVKPFLVYALIQHQLKGCITESLKYSTLF